MDVQVNALGGIGDTLGIAELFAAQEVDVHVDTLLHRGDLWVYAPNIEERLDIAPAKNGREALARCRQARQTSAHLTHA